MSQWTWKNGCRPPLHAGKVGRPSRSIAATTPTSTPQRHHCESLRRIAATSRGVGDRGNLKGKGGLDRETPRSFFQPSRCPPSFLPAVFLPHRRTTPPSVAERAQTRSSKGAKQQLQETPFSFFITSFRRPVLPLSPPRARHGGSCFLSQNRADQKPGRQSPLLPSCRLELAAELLPPHTASEIW